MANAIYLRALDLSVNVNRGGNASITAGDGPQWSPTEKLEWIFMTQGDSR